jgi:AcrR family transcriptional regulator
MQTPVKPRRRYHSPQRQLQAQATRQQIVDAAARLFVRDGYFGTTIDAIAREAGVAPPTVYATFRTKRAILSDLIDSLIFGDDPSDTPVAQRTWYRELANQPDAASLLRRWGAYLCEVNARVAPVQRIVQSAAFSDPTIGELWQRMKDQRLTGQRAIAQLLVQRQALRPGLTVAEAADIIFVLSDANLYDAYTSDRGWSPSQVGQWLGSAFCHLLLTQT